MTAGRPSLHAHSTITLRLTAKQYKKLITMSLRTQRPMNAIIRTLIERAK